ncbi:MAG: NepR family anti-sigma factor [Amaricoccus sp.]
MRKHDWIARQLRRVYDEALDEEVPADMLAILAKLDEPPSGREGGA